MLQQTTVATVKPRFAAFLARFPNVHALAAADERDVLHGWQGLGYYRRARALHACARAIVEQHGGEVPDEEAALRALPGIGPYTASAIRAIAYGAPTVPVDGNVLRVMARLHGIETPLPAGIPELRSLAAALSCDASTGARGAGADGPRCHRMPTASPRLPGLSMAAGLSRASYRAGRAIASKPAQEGATAAPRPGLSAGAARWRHPVPAPPVRRAARRSARAALEPLARRAAGRREGARACSFAGQLGLASGHDPARLHAFRSRTRACQRQHRRQHRDRQCPRGRLVRARRVRSARPADPNEEDFATCRDRFALAPVRFCG